MISDRIWFRIVFFIRRRRIFKRFFKQREYYDNWPSNKPFKAGDVISPKGFDNLEDGDYMITGEYCKSVKIEKKTP